MSSQSSFYGQSGISPQLIAAWGQYVSQAQASAAAALVSQTAAAASSTSASSSASSASTSASGSSTSATAAAASQTAAAGSATSASTSATTATTQASTATTQATNAGTSATGAATSATNAANSATAASGSAGAAATSAVNAANSATAAANSASTLNIPAPSTDNGQQEMVRVNPTKTGYELRTPAAVWQDILTGAAGRTAGPARSDLGLGTAATQNTGTTGHTLPFADGTNNWTGGQTFTGAATFPSGASFTGGSVSLTTPINETFTTSAATPTGGLLDISAIAANQIDLSQASNAAINAFGGGLPVGAERTIRWTGVTPGTLSNSASLSLPGAQNIPLNQYDETVIRCLTAGAFGTWILISHTPYNDPAIYGKASAATTLAGTDAKQFLTAAGFAGNKSLASPGYYKLPGGLIFQWGSVSIAATSSATVTFPLAFTSAVFTLQATIGTAATTANATNAVSLGLTQASIFNGGGGTNTIYWFAVGV